MADFLEYLEKHSGLFVAIGAILGIVGVIGGWLIRIWQLRRKEIKGEIAEVVDSTEPPTPLPGNPKTFEEVIKAILASHPGAPLGRTVEQGPYHKRAKGMTKYRLYTADPPWYGAVQPNGKTMWLYLGKGGKICCGDKE